MDIAAHLLGVRADMLRENFVSRRFQSKGRSSAYCVPLDPPKVRLLLNFNILLWIINIGFRLKMEEILSVKIYMV